MALVQVDEEVRRLCEAGETHAAVTAAIRGLGAELMGFLVAVTGHRDDAGDVFADTCVRMWKGLAGFRWESSLRTWVYTLARRAVYEHRARRAADVGRHVPLSQVPEIDEMIARVRTTTLAHLREERQSRAERLRARLSADDRMLLTLRVDRGMEWRDIARVLAEDGDDADPAAADSESVDRAAGALRKRFERLKATLRKMAAEDDGG